MKISKGMARTIAVMLCIAQLVGFVPYAHVHAHAETECVHNDVEVNTRYELKSGEEWADDKNGKTHSALCEVYTSYDCFDCYESWEVQGEDTVHAKEHVFSYEGGMCLDCGAANVCAHEDTTTKTGYQIDASGWVDDKNGETHTAPGNWVTYYTCNDCGSGWKEIGARDSFTKDHSFNADGVCRQCGASSACEHSDAEMYHSYFVLAEGEEWKDNGDGTHSGLVYEVLSYRCEDCDSEWSESDPTKTEIKSDIHEFNSLGICRECGISNECKHPDGSVDSWIEYTLSEGEEWTANDDGKTHTGLASEVKTFYCETCGTYWNETGEEKEYNLPHTFGDDDICEDCGAENTCEHPDTSVTFRNEFVLAEGEEWVSDGDGKHHTGKAYEVNYFYCEECNTDWEESDPSTAADYTEMHTFNKDMICTKCGADNVCEHPEENVITISHYTLAEGEKWIANDDGLTHTGLAFKTEQKQCKDCGNVWVASKDETAQSYTNDHDMSEDGVCYECGFGGECEHPAESVGFFSIYELVEGEKWVDNKDGETHSGLAQEITVFRCSACGEEWEEADEDGAKTHKLPHNLDAENECEDCGASLSMKITKQPVDAAAVVGEKAETAIEVEGYGLTYSWYFSDDDGETFTKSTLTTSTYSITMNEERDGRKVYCVVTDKFGGSIQSETVTFTAVKKVTITKQPVNASAFVDEDAVVSIEAKGEGLTYAWYYKNADKTSYTKSSVTTPEYATTMSAARDGRQVYCVVTDKYGNEAKSNVVTLSIKTELKITTQPKSQVVSAGDSATFKVVAKGDGLTYAWYYKDAGAESFTKSSVTNASYTTTMKESRDGREIYCVVTDRSGNSVQSDIVTITLPVVKITTQPKDMKVSADEYATFKVSAEGDGLKYTWYYKNAGASSFTKSSNSGSSYRVLMTEKRDGREIYCVVTDKYGNSVQSDVVTLTLPVLKITSQPTNKTVASGKSATFKVGAEGDGLKYAWYYRNAGASSYTKSTVSKASYTTTMTEVRDGRQIYCVVTDAYGNSAETNVVTMTLPTFGITSQPTSQSAAEGESVTFTVSAIGDGLKYTWYYKDTDDSSYTKSSVKSASYTTTVKESRDGRKIYCIVTDQYGSKEKSKVVTMTVEK